MSLLKAAIDYAVSKKMKIIPLHDVATGKCSCNRESCSEKEAGKHPRVAAWQKAATTDLKIIAEWWGRWPNANIGVVTGKQNGFFGVDIDDLAVWQQLISECGSPEPTFSYRSGSGLPHFWFRWPDDQEVTNRTGTLPYGVDIRGNGGYLVVPPSRTLKGEYSGTADVPIAAAPTWLLEKIKPTKAETGLVSASDLAAFRDLSKEERRRIRAYVDDAFESELSRLSIQALEGHHWDPTTFEVAANLMEFAKAPWAPVTVEEVELAIEDAVPEFDNEGWNQQRLTRILESARRRVFEKDGCRPFPTKSEVDPQFAKELDAFFVSVKEVGEMKDPAFLWEGKLLANELSLLVGDGGMGKGLLCAYLIKNLGEGTLDGDFKGTPIRSLFISQEEVYNVHTLPRLKASGMHERALAENVVFGDLSKLQSDVLTLDSGKLNALLNGCVRRGIKVVILDPLQSFLSGGVDANNPQQVQRALTPIGLAAHRFGISVIGIHHINKGNEGRASNKVSGSMAWRNTARSVLYLEKSPDESEDGFDRVITALKNNYAAEAKPLRYKTESVRVEGLNKEVGKLVLGGVLDSSVEEIAAESSKTARDKSYELSQRNKAEVLLIKMLSEVGESGMEPRTIKYAVSRRLGTTDKTVVRAFNELKKQGVVDTTARQGVSGVWKIIDKDRAEKYRNMIDPQERFNPKDLLV